MTGAFFLGSIFGWILVMAGFAAARSRTPVRAVWRVAGLFLLFTAAVFCAAWLLIDWRAGVIAVTGMAASASLAMLVWTALEGRKGRLRSRA